MKAIVLRLKQSSSNILFRDFDCVLCEVDLKEASVSAPWSYLKKIQPIEVVESAKGFPVLHRGYFDSHLHQSWMGELMSSLDFTQCQSPTEMLHEYLAHSKRFPAKVVRGYGWDEEKMGISLQELTQFFSKNFPQDKELIFSRICGHRALVSHKVGEWYGQQAFAAGDLVISEGILFSLFDRLPEFTDSQRQNNFLAAQNRLLSLGISGVGDMSIEGKSFETVKKIAANGKLLLDYVGVMDAGKIMELEKTGPCVISAEGISPYLGRCADLRVPYWKKYLDGSLGARTAWLSEPYLDAETFGEMLFDTIKLSNEASSVLQTDFRMSFHAIGDAAIDQALEIGRRLLKYKKHKLRHRLEHAQVLRDDQIQELARQDQWIIHVQPGHKIADQHFVSKRLGKQRLFREGYRLKSIYEAGVPVVLGSDAPIDTCEPEKIIESATQGLEMHECLSREATLWSMTSRPRLLEGIESRAPLPGDLVLLSNY